MKTIALDQKSFQTVSRQAKKLGTTPEQYVRSLIAHANRSFDEILAPVRKGFEHLSDEELDALFQRANTAARKRLRSRR